jgi:dipeptidyl aminopeptidase/acylaminoacyl peptidase
LKYLTVPQVLWDFIDVIDVIKNDQSYANITNKAVIVGGGSYGGMLSAWMRMKYPN